MVIEVKDKSGNVVRIIKTEDYKNTVVIGKTVIHSSPQPVSNEDLQNILKYRTKYINKQKLKFNRMTEDNITTNVQLGNGNPAFAKPVLGEGAVIGWWSGGITSAVACRLAIEKYPNVRLIYIETGSHHPDTMRFKSDCEKWYGQEIETIQNKKYENHLDVVLSTRYVNGAGGARCTKELKKNVRFDFEKSTKIAAQVWGYEFAASEINRAIRTQEQYAYTNPLFPLIENKLSKNECAGILAGAGIEIPMMYKLGYNNNNCIGCVKGGAGYWNKIRVDFPEIFKQMAEAEREVNATCLKDKNGRIYLDELDPNAGNPTDLVTGECGIFCQVEFAHIMSKRTNDILEGKVSIYAGL